MSTQHPVAGHYTRGDLLKRFEQGLRAIGKSPECFTADDIASADQFHTGGKLATLELARLAGICKEDHVLDVGGAIGGPARTLAREIGCRVTVLDLTSEFIDVGRELTTRTGLGDHITFHQGNALDLPFSDSFFDIVLTQHASMNIPDKLGLIREASRVLRLGGKFAFHDIMAGPLQPILFPVPWAVTPDNSFLAAPTAIRPLINAQGLRELAWHDESEAAIKFFQERAAAAQQSAPNPMSVRLLLGEKAPRMFETLARNFAENRVVAIMAVAEKNS